jgi:hypothetical protein
MVEAALVAGPTGGATPARPFRHAALTIGEVDDCHIDLAARRNAIESLRRLLSPDEVARAYRFHFEADPRRFTLARTAMRQILARYAASAPPDLAFLYGGERQAGAGRGRAPIGNPVQPIALVRACPAGGDPEVALRHRPRTGRLRRGESGPRASLLCDGRVRGFLHTPSKSKGGRVLFLLDAQEAAYEGGWRGVRGRPRR